MCARVLCAHIAPWTVLPRAQGCCWALWYRGRTSALSWLSYSRRRDNPNHAKAYYRRGVAISYLGEFDAAKEDLELAAELDAAMKDDVERELMRMTIRKRSEEVKAKQQFANFFARQ